MVPAHSRALAALITGVVPLIAAVISLVVSFRAQSLTRTLQAEKAASDHELQAQRGRLDQLDRLHSRRVEKIEALYSAIEDAVHVLLRDLPDPDHKLQGFEQMTALRLSHSAARIYLSDEADRLCLDLIEEVQRAWEAGWLASEYGMTDVSKLPEAVKRDLDGYEACRQTGIELRDKRTGRAGQTPSRHSDPCGTGSATRYTVA
jgi:hypothetical protein